MITAELEDRGYKASYSREILPTIGPDSWRHTYRTFKLSATARASCDHFGRAGCQTSKDGSRVQLSRLPRSERFSPGIYRRWVPRTHIAAERIEFLRQPLRQTSEWESSHLTTYSERQAEEDQAVARDYIETRQRRCRCPCPSRHPQQCRVACRRQRHQAGGHQSLHRCPQRLSCPYYAISTTTGRAELGASA